MFDLSNFVSLKKSMTLCPTVPRLPNHKPLTCHSRSPNFGAYFSAKNGMHFSYIFDFSSHISLSWLMSLLSYLIVGSMMNAFFDFGGKASMSQNLPRPSVSTA